MELLFYKQDKTHRAEIGKKTFYRIKNVSDIKEIQIRVSNICVPRILFSICQSDGKKCIENKKFETISIKPNSIEPIVLIIPLLEDKPIKKTKIPKDVVFNISIQKKSFGIPEDASYFFFFIICFIFHSLFLCKLFNIFVKKRKNQ